MGLNGQEQRIQALFRELRLADECGAAPFVAEPQRVRGGESPRQSTFGLVPVATGLALICLIVPATVFFLNQRQQISDTRPQLPGVLSRSPDTKPSSPLQSSVVRQKPKQIKAPAVGHKLSRSLAAARRSYRKKEIAPAAIALSRWQSPTGSLLQSPSEGLLRSFPQIDHSSRELKTFLPERLN